MIFTVTLNPALDKTVTIPAFAVGKVNRVAGMRLDPGGKGINVSKTIQSLDGQSVAMGILGGAAGRYIESCLNGMGIETDFVHTKASTRTNLKIIDPAQKTNTDINEAGENISGAAVHRVFLRLMNRVAPGDFVVLAGKSPPQTRDTLFEEWARQLKSLGAKVCMDVDGPMLLHGVEAAPDLIKPNEEEFERLTGKRFSSLKELALAALDLNSRGTAHIAVSLGDKGALFVKEGRALYARGLKVPVKSTVGAGDAMMAALVLTEARGGTWQDAIRLAVAAGAAAVMCEGTEAVSGPAVREFAQQVVMEDVQL